MLQKEEQGGLRLIDIFYFQQEQLLQVVQVVQNKDLVDGYLNHQIHLINLY